MAAAAVAQAGPAGLAEVPTARAVSETMITISIPARPRDRETVCESSERRSTVAVQKRRSKTHTLSERRQYMSRRFLTFFVFVLTALMVPALSFAQDQQPGGGGAGGGGGGRAAVAVVTVAVAAVAAAAGTLIPRSSVNA